MVALPANPENPGSVRVRGEYFPYGKSSDRRDERNRYRYIGVERDEATGLMMTGPRTYQSDTGRFLQGDPHITEARQRTPYAYTSGQPLRASDASGYKPDFDPLPQEGRYEVAPSSQESDLKTPTGQPYITEHGSIPNADTTNAPSADLILEELYASGLDRPQVGGETEMTNLDVLVNIRTSASQGELTQHEAVMALFLDTRFHDDGSVTSRFETLIEVLIDSPNMYPRLDSEISRFFRPTVEGTQGFAPLYDDSVTGEDPRGNQASHALQGLLVGYIQGTTAQWFDLNVSFGLLVHEELVLETLAYSNNRVVTIEEPAGRGRSLADLYLFREGQNVGLMAAEGDLTRDELAAFLWALGSQEQR